MLLVLLRPKRRDDEERHDDDRADPEFDDGVEIVNGLAIDDQLRRINKDAVDDILECCATICEQTDNAPPVALRGQRSTASMPPTKQRMTPRPKPKTAMLTATQVWLPTGAKQMPSMPTSMTMPKTMVVTE